jgi:hypothetical protein
MTRTSSAEAASLMAAVPVAVGEEELAHGFFYSSRDSKDCTSH